MDFEKWANIESRDEPVGRVADRLLGTRLAAVAHYLPLAADKAEEDPEHVHQLRVWSRRATASVALFKKQLPKPIRQTLKQELTDVRRAAGAARDADVLLIRLSSLKTGMGKEYLLAEGSQARAAVQQPIQAIHEKLHGGNDLLALVETDESEPSKRDKKPFATWARKRLKRQVKEFIRCGQGNLQDVAALHEFRIAGKRLRYTIELVGDVFGKRLRKKLYPQLDAIQTKLGTLNDLSNFINFVVAANRRADERPVKTQIRRFLREARKALAESRQTWDDYWTPERIKQLKRQFKKIVRQ